MHGYSLYESGRHEGAVHERQSAQQTQRADEAHQPRVVADVQRDHQRGEGVRLAYVSAVRRVRRLLGPANGKHRLYTSKINYNNIAFIRRIKTLKM